MTLTNVLALSLVVICSATEAFITTDVVNHVKGLSDPDVIPRTSASKPIELNLGMSVLEIENVDTVGKTVDLHVWIDLSWNGGITFDPRRFNNVSFIRLPSQRLWIPDIAVYNGDLALTPNKLSDRVVLQNDGDVLWVPKAKIRAFCDVSDASLAHNTTCTIKIGSWTYSAFELSLLENPRIELGNFNANSRFQLLAASAKKESLTYECCEEQYDNLLFTISFMQK